MAPYISLKIPGWTLTLTLTLTRMKDHDASHVLDIVHRGGILPTSWAQTCLCGLLC